jgi:hypothetical protein
VGAVALKENKRANALLGRFNTRFVGRISAFVSAKQKARDKKKKKQ